MNTSETPPVRPGWGLFVILAVMLVVIFGLVTSLRGDPSMRLPMGLGCMSIIGFLAFRWHALRKLVLSGEVSPSDLKTDFRSHLLGPLLPRVVWLGLTVIGVVAVVILQASS